MKDILKPPEVARILGCSIQKVREHMRQGVWDIGEVIPKKKSGKKGDEFNIYRTKFETHIGRKLTEEDFVK